MVPSRTPLWSQKCGILCRWERPLMLLGSDPNFWSLPFKDFSLTALMDPSKHSTIITTQKQEPPFCRSLCPLVDLCIPYLSASVHFHDFKTQLLSTPYSCPSQTSLLKLKMFTAPEINKLDLHRLTALVQCLTVSYWGQGLTLYYRLRSKNKLPPFVRSSQLLMWL